MPQRPSTSYGAFGAVPRPPDLQPPPPYMAVPNYPDGGYQRTYVRQCQRDSSPLRPVTITKGGFGVSVIFLIILAQAAAFIFFYDLPSMIDRYGRIKEELRKERERWEKAREDRVPHGAFWDTPWPARGCYAYGKREYHGTLNNIPEGWTNMDACMNLPVEIKGVSIRRPDRCAYVGGSPHIHGYWMVDWDQPDCKPWHRDVTDKVSLGKRSPLNATQKWMTRDVRTQGLAFVALKLGLWVSTIDQSKTGVCCVRARLLRGTTSPITLLPTAWRA